MNYLYADPGEETPPPPDETGHGEPPKPPTKP